MIMVNRKLTQHLPYSLVIERLSKHFHRLTDVSHTSSWPGRKLTDFRTMTLARIPLTKTSCPFRFLLTCISKRNYNTEQLDDHMSTRITFHNDFRNGDHYNYTHSIHTGLMNRLPLPILSDRVWTVLR